MTNNSLETSLTETCSAMAEACTAYTEECEEKIRRAPLASVLCAAAVGYFLQFLPLTRIVWGLIRTFVWLIQPALLTFGAFKLLSLVKNGDAAVVEEKMTAQRSENPF